jgi:hypothetical protein
MWNIDPTKMQITEHAEGNFHTGEEGKRRKLRR